MSAARAPTESRAAFERELLPLEPLARLVRVFQRFGDRVRIASSFSLEDAVMVHLAARARDLSKVEPRVFMVNTSQLHAEAYDLVERVRVTYGLSISLYAPPSEALQKLLGTRGASSPSTARNDPDVRREVEKAELLGRALEGADAWVTGLRRDQVSARGASLVEEDDARPGVMKVSPLFDWTFAEVLRFAETDHVPFSPLVAKTYPWMGRAPAPQTAALPRRAKRSRWA